MSAESLVFTADHVMNILGIILGGMNALALAIATPFAVKLANRQKATVSTVTEVKKKTEEIKGKTEEIHGQTVNHHPAAPNMREENDGRHAEIMRVLTHQGHKIGRQGDMIDELLILGLENRYKIEALEKGRD